MEEHGYLDREPRKIPVGDLAGLQEIVLASDDDLVSEVVERMRNHAISQLPVIDSKGELTGLVSEMDLLNLLLESRNSGEPVSSIAPVVRRGVRRANHQKSLGEVLPELLEDKVVVLVDNQGHPNGILTIIDALAYLSKREA